MQCSLTVGYCRTGSVRGQGAREGEAVGLERWNKQFYPSLRDLLREHRTSENTLEGIFFTTLSEE